MMSFTPVSSASNMRRINFTHNEKLLLVSLVEKNKCWIVDHMFSTDGSVSWRKKSDVWNDITREFNLLSECPVHRDMRQLRKCWENLKTRYRNTRNSLKHQDSLGCSDANDSAFGTSELKDLYKRVGSLVAVIDNQRAMGCLMGQNEASDVMKSTSYREIQTSPLRVEIEKEAKREISLSDQIDSAMSESYSNSVSFPSNHLGSEEEVSIIQVTSGTSSPELVSAKSISPPGGATTTPRYGAPTSVNVERPSKTKASIFSASGITKRNLIFKNHSKPNIGASKARQPVFGRVRLASPTVDTEKLLRVRFLRNRVREQELRMRMMQQKMRLERERHEAVMTLLHKQATHFENQADRLHEQFQDDNDLCDDWLMNVT